ncbi:hypothetical protein MMPV_005724 [Pyropia vietnamensis]
MFSVWRAVGSAVGRLVARLSILTLDGAATAALGGWPTDVPPAVPLRRLVLQRVPEGEASGLSASLSRVAPSLVDLSLSLAGVWRTGSVAAMFRGVGVLSAVTDLALSLGVGDVFNGELGAAVTAAVPAMRRLSVSGDVQSGWGASLGVGEGERGNEARLPALSELSLAITDTDGGGAAAEDLSAALACRRLARLSLSVTEDSDVEGSDDDEMLDGDGSGGSGSDAAHLHGIGNGFDNGSGNGDIGGHRWGVAGIGAAVAAAAALPAELLLSGTRVAPAEVQRLVADDRAAKTLSRLSLRLRGGAPLAGKVLSSLDPLPALTHLSVLVEVSAPIRGWLGVRGGGGGGRPRRGRGFRR